jgi:hypothetical protein
VRRQEADRGIVDRQAAVEKLLLINPARRHEHAAQIPGVLKYFALHEGFEAAIVERQMHSQGGGHDPAGDQPDPGLEFHSAGIG